MDAANKVKNHLNDDLKNITDEVNSLTDDVKKHLKNGEAALADHGFKAKARESFEEVKEGYETAREAVLDLGRKLNWKAALGVTAGLVVIVGLVVVTRRRHRRGTLIERGIHEGARYAMLVPEGWHKAQHHALHIAQNSARESARLWKKIPRLHVELK